MICDKCGDKTKVFDSRVLGDGQLIYRRRRCDNCFNKFTTYEEKYRSKNDRLRSSNNN
jgi:transcriptional regulator NrdR family protein